MMDTFLTNFDDTERDVPVEPEYSNTGEFWSEDPQLRTCTKQPPQDGEKKLNDSIDPDGD